MKKLLDLATLNEKNRFWYAHQNKALKAFCISQGWDFKTFCEVLAITSPRVPLKRNFKFTCNYMHGEDFYCTPLPSVFLSLKHYEKTGEIRGLKTRAFAKALQGDKNAVVLDVYMSLIFRVDQKLFGTKSGYAQTSNKLCKVANALNWTPAQTQAALWCNYLQAQGKTVYSYTNILKQYLTFQ